MASIYDKASLVLIPSGTKTSKVYSQKPTNGDGDFTFSRSTAATRVNASGNIEKETQNLLLQSNGFNTGSWGNVFSASPTGGESGYDGSNDAWLLSSVSGSASRVYQNTSSGVDVNSLSVYAKANTLTWARLQISTASGNYVSDFDLVNGVSGYTFNNPLPSIESVGNGWYRIKITAFDTSTQLRIYAATGNNDLSGAGSIYIQDAQLEQGLVARDYIETTTTAIYGGITDNVPRLDYTDSSCPALLLEPQRFNAIDSSEYGGAWSAINANITKTENATTSPEGVNNAVKLEGLTTSSANQIVNFGTTSLNGVNVVGKTYTASVYLKPVNAGDVGKDIVLSIQRNTGDFEGFNVTTEITSADWKRYDLTYTFTGAGAGDQVGATFKILSPVSTTIDDIYIWGVQFEEGSYATSYIPTYGSAVTRNGDVSETQTPNTLLFGQTEGTLFCEYTPVSDDTTNQSRFIRLRNSSNSNQIYMQHNVLNNVNAVVFNGSNQFVGQTPTGYASVGNTYKFALAYKDGDYAFYANGVQIDVGTATGLGTLAIDRLDLDNQNMSKASRVNQSLVFNTRLSNEELATLTTI